MQERLTAVTRTTDDVFPAGIAPPVPPLRTSQALREILTKNPTVKHFTVKRIVDSLKDSRAGTSLVFFSIPGMVPVPGAANLAGFPASAIAGQMIAGKTEIKLPKIFLERSVPRRSLAVAIHAILPILEKAEKALKPRWRWASHPSAQRVLGVLIFLLAIAIAFPVLGFNLPHAVSVFIISLGLVEQDGLAILIGVTVGLASLILLTAGGFSGRALRSRVGVWLKNIATKSGVKWVKWTTAFFKKFGLLWPSLLEFEWTTLLLLWDPEEPSRRVKKRAGNPAKRAQREANPRIRQACAAGLA